MRARWLRPRVRRNSGRWPACTATAPRAGAASLVGDKQVAAHGDLQAAAEGQSVDGGYGGFGKVVELREHCVLQRQLLGDDAAGYHERLELRYVGAGAE